MCLYNAIPPSRDKRTNFDNEITKTKMKIFNQSNMHQLYIIIRYNNDIHKPNKSPMQTQYLRRQIWMIGPILNASKIFILITFGY